MERFQQYLHSLLEKVPAWELSDPEHQSTFNKIKGRLLESSDLHIQLTQLYRVTDFSELALGLMWLAEKADRDPSKLESTSDEESFVLGLLKKAFGESSQGDGMGGSMVAEHSSGFDSGMPSSAESVQPTDATTAGLTAAPVSPSEGSAGSEALTGSADAAGDGNEQKFSKMLEALLESVQSGSDNRTNLLEGVVKEAEGVVSGQSYESDFKTFCGYLVEFLNYISANQLYDDIRVMNLMSNVYDPFSQWIAADRETRTGMLEQPIEMLREFKSLFE